MYYYYFENAALRASERWQYGEPVNKSIIGDELHNNAGIMPFPLAKLVKVLNWKKYPVCKI